MPAFGDYQNEIYFKGLHGVKPKLPVNFSLLEQIKLGRLCLTMFYLMSQAVAATSTLRTRTSPRSSAGV
jgi:lactate 2-monooxygenase